MPIVDYKLLGDRARNTLFKNEAISKINLEYVSEYIDQYNVSAARINIFYRHIGKFLVETEDVKQDMQDRKKINSIFAKLRRELSQVYYATVINVTLTFVRWLNEGDKPSGFKDITNVSKKSTKRKLTPSDMLTWEDAKKLADNTTSIQTKALILMQCEGGFRPSEIYDVKLRDVQISGNHLEISVDGKTGQRTVLLHKAAPSLMYWLDNHPYKDNKQSFLWVIENFSKVHRSDKENVSTRPSYNALVKKIRTAGAKAKIDKPLDFYNLRHSSAVINKMDGWPVDIVAANMGHSIEEHINTYGRLTVKDNIVRLNKIHGSKDEVNAKNLPIECKSCHQINEPGIEYCTKCNNPLLLTTALRDSKKTSDEFEEMKKQNAELNKKMDLLAKLMMEKYNVNEEIEGNVSRETFSEIFTTIKSK